MSVRAQVPEQTSSEGTAAPFAGVSDGRSVREGGRRKGGRERREERGREEK